MFAFGIFLLVPDQKPVVKKIVEKPIVIPHDPFDDINLIAKSVFVMDIATEKVLFAKNEEVQLPLASVTKVMTALVASKIPGDTIVSIQGEDLQSGPGGLNLFEKWNLKDLINYTLVISSNSGSHAIAGAAGAFIKNSNGDAEAPNMEVFLDRMNETAKDLHMDQTFYLNPSGLDVDVSGEISGAYGSARDMALLFAHIIKNEPDLLQATAYDSLVFKSADGFNHRAENTNIVTREIPGLIASKTGYTELADGNLVIAFDVGPAHPVIVAVLGSTQDGRFTDVEQLVSASIKKITQE
jgi:D-alanyl-D-alanine carboxypeptidase (penicillin-binding protein 5/6)